MLEDGCRWEDTGRYRITPLQHKYSFNNILDTAFIVLYNRSNFRSERETSLKDSITIRHSNFRFLIPD